MNEIFALPKASMFSSTSRVGLNSKTKSVDRVKRLTVLVAVLPILSSFVGCVSKPQPKSNVSKSAKVAAVEKAAEDWRPRLGKVALVDEKAGFVLLDIGTAPAPAAGIGLRSYSANGSSSELTVSAFQRRPFLIANIVKGHPVQGDPVGIVSGAGVTAVTPELPKVGEEVKESVSGGEKTADSAKKAAAPKSVRYVVPPKTDSTQYVPVITEPTVDGVIPGLPAMKKN